MVSDNLVSVIVATRNCASTLRRCLQSISEQSYQRIEIIVVDGGSTDGTLQVLHESRERLSDLICEPDEGIYDAWNKGVRIARGTWICFLGGDDAYHDRESVRDLVQTAANTGSRVIYGRMNLITPAGVLAETVGRPWPVARSGFLAGFMIPHPGTLHHHSLFEQHGGFDKSYRIAGDYEFLLRELSRGDAAFCDRVVVDMRLGGMSVRPDSIYAALREVWHARRAHGLTDLPARLVVALAASWIGVQIYTTLGERTFAALADAYRSARGKPRVWTV